MKFIQKGSSPTAFEGWKAQTNSDWQASWDNFQNPEKKEVKEALLIEQGYLCCYCGVRIENNYLTEIEHIKPKSQCIGSEESKALDFNNFLASCNGSTKEPKPREVHCNNARGDQVLAVSPLSSQCESRFLYTESGEIIPASSNDNSVKNLINNVLKLNAKKIQGMRKEIIAGLEEDFSEASDEEIKEEIVSLSQKEENKFKEMCFVCVSYLRNTLS